MERPRSPSHFLRYAGRSQGSRLEFWIEDPNTRRGLQASRRWTARAAGWTGNNVARWRRFSRTAWSCLALGSVGRSPDCTRQSTCHTRSCGSPGPCRICVVRSRSDISSCSVSFNLSMWTSLLLILSHTLVGLQQFKEFLYFSLKPE